MSEGVDYSWARPGGALLVERGKSFAGRYLYSGGKGLSNGELADLRAYGIEIFVIYQEGTGEWADGFGAGARQAIQAQGQLDALDLPRELPIYFTCDSETGNSNLGAVQEFARGAASVLGAARTGIYGSYAVVESVVGSGNATWGFQTLAWSGGRLSARANLYQYQIDISWPGGAVDYVRSLTPEYGQNPPGQPKPGITESVAITRRRR